MTTEEPTIQSIAVQCYSTAILGALTAQLTTIQRTAKSASLAIEEMPGAEAQKEVMLPALADLENAVWTLVDSLRCDRTTLDRLIPGMMDMREDDA